LNAPRIFSIHYELLDDFPVSTELPSTSFYADISVSQQKYRFAPGAYWERAGGFNFSTEISCCEFPAEDVVAQSFSSAP